MAISLILGAFNAWSDNEPTGCQPNPSPTLINITCHSVGSITNPGTLYPTLDIICVGGSSGATVSGTGISRGFKILTFWDGCHTSLQWQPITYTPNYWWQPPIPDTFNTPGTFTFTNMVQGISLDPDCPEPTAITNAGTLTVVVSASPPVIITQPANQTASVGGNATFTVTVSTCTPTSYQWWFANPITGATNSTLNLANVQLNNAGCYFVTVSNASGSVNSVPATLTVLVPPAITFQPTGQTVCAGATVHFSVTATGSPLSYQWWKGSVQLSDGGNVSGSTTPTLTLANVSEADAANYTVVVSNGNQGVTSSAAALVVSATCVPPTIITPPQNQTTNAGAIVHFTVGVYANAGQPLFYQWQKNGVNLIDGGEVFGATTATLTLQGVTTADAGSYTVTVSNGGGSATSVAAILSVSGSCGITITGQPASWSATAGSTVTFSVTASGSGLTYQWLKNGGNVSGANTPTLTLTNVSSADAGRYTVSVCNSSCCVASQPATLTVNGFNVRITEPKDNAILP